jgi:hypothetical protein
VINLAYNKEEMESWKFYDEGITYKQRIGLYEEVNKHERFYSGRQWDGVVANGLPTPVLNLIRRITDHKINTVMGEDIKVNYSVDGVDDTDNTPDSEEIREIAKMMSAYAMTVWENLDEDIKNEMALLDAALSGDGIEYFYWDPTINAGNGIMGGIASEMVDNVNYFPGNPNSSDVQSQPKITIAFRKMVKELKQEAKRNGIPKEEYDTITDDEDTEYQAGDHARIELDKSGKTICLLSMWKEEYSAPHVKAGQKRVMFEKSTRYSRITKGAIDSELTLYPVAVMNWGRRKNCCHGVSEVKGLIPNQIAINKLVAMIIMSVMHTAFPKAVYDATRIAGWSNIIGGAIGMNGGNVKDAAAYLQPGQLSNDIYKTVDLLIQLTKDMVGATDAALGELNMDNTSALIVLQKASAIPLKSISKRYYKFIEDKARIWMDFFLHKYTGTVEKPVERTLTYKDQGVTRTFNFDGQKYGDLQWRVKVDVGTSSHWSEITNLQTLDNLLMNGHITFPQYLERLPNGIISMKEKLMQENASADIDRQIMFKMMAEYVEGLPPEMQQEIRSMKPEEMEARVKEMILQEGGQVA